MMTLTSVIEPLRMVNKLLGENVFDWRFFTLTDTPQTASCGITISPDGSLSDKPWGDTVLICAGIEHTPNNDKALRQWLWQHARKGSYLGGVSTGPTVLAEAELLDGYRCTLHWENLLSFSERFQKTEVTSNLFEIDRKRLTCAGGTAAMDLMLSIIKTQFGEELSTQVADQFMHDHARSSHDSQRQAHTSLNARKSPKLAEAIELMMNHPDEPLSPRDIALRAGLSLRQLERLFKKFKKCTPQAYYLSIRLDHARRLLVQTELPLLEIAIASGFVSQSHFTKCYREHYGQTPLRDRRNS